MDFAPHPPDLLKKNAEKCTATQISEKKHSFVENKPSFAPPFFLLKKKTWKWAPTYEEER